MAAAAAADKWQGAAVGAAAVTQKHSRVFSQTAEHEHEQEKDEESVFLRKFTSVQEKIPNTFVWRSVQDFFPLNTEHRNETVTTKNTEIDAKLTCGQGVQNMLSHVKNVFMIGKLNSSPNKRG